MLRALVRSAAPRSARLATLAVAAPRARPLVARAARAATELTAAGLLGASSTAVLCKSAPSSAAGKADALFDAAQYDALVQLLCAAIPESPNDAELHWRLARGCKKLSDAAPKAEQEKLLRQGLQSAERALALQPECGPAHKWYAICLSQVGAFEGTKGTIKNSFVVRDHFERAIQFSPEDATSRHLLGLWCFEVAKLSWIEQKAAAVLFATPPIATFAEAAAHFEAAEKMDPGFYPKNLLLLAQTYARLGRKAEAEALRLKCLDAIPTSPEDEETQREAAKLKW